MRWPTTSIELKPDSAVVVMSWDKVAVPFKVSVDVNKVVEASLQQPAPRPVAVHLGRLGRCRDLPGRQQGGPDRSPELREQFHRERRPLRERDDEVQDSGSDGPEIRSGRRPRKRRCLWAMPSNSTATAASFSVRASSRTLSRSSSRRRPRTRTTGSRTPGWLASPAGQGIILRRPSRCSWRWPPLPIRQSPEWRA